MIIELITPLMLATAPMTIQQIEPLKYSHEKQAIELTSPTVLAQIRQYTYNGTQTFNPYGRPSDSDND
jgi:hypothetical protein